jgi:hypothetical protein
MMPKPKTFAREDVERVRSILAKTPEKPKAPAPMTQQEMITSIGAEIRDLQKRGYELDEIAAIIRDGFNLDTLGASTLRRYLQKKRKKPSSEKAPTKTETLTKAVNLERKDDTLTNLRTTS